MKNQLWHFGDSFAACDVEREDIFSKYISDYFNFDLNHCAKGGSSNFGIFNEILKNISDFKSGDILLINWSYLDRSQFFEKERNSSKQLKSSNIIIQKIISINDKYRIQKLQQIIDKIS
jgi:hypothetical protein